MVIIVPAAIFVGNAGFIPINIDVADNIFIVMAVYVAVSPEIVIEAPINNGQWSVGAVIVIAVSPIIPGCPNIALVIGTHAANDKLNDSPLYL